jgi:hypothetical protein
VKNNNELLSSLFDWDTTPQQQQQKQVVIEAPKQAVVVPKRVLTVQQAQTAATLARQGISVSKILVEHLKITNGDRYAEAKPHVEAIWYAVNKVQRKG